MSKPTPTEAHPTERPGRVILAGWGLITPLGLGAWATFASLLKGRTLSDRASELPDDTAPIDLARALGCVASVQHGHADPAIELAERAVREAAGMANLSPTGLPLWLGTSKGAIAHVSKHLGRGQPITEAIATCLCLGPHAYLSHQLSRRLHTTAMGHHVAACSSGLVALDRARRALLHAPPGASPYAMVASADAAITPALVHSYKRLGVLGEMTTQTYTQRPLDERRQGFMLSEVGVAVLLKRIEPGEPLPTNAIQLTDTATACEPYDIIRSPGTMTRLARLWQQVTRGQSIDVIHPHAPGTREHDPAELGVLLQPPSPTPSHAPTSPDLYAVKGAIGHSLGASGLASLVVAAMSLRSGKRPPMPWLDQPMKLPTGDRLQVDPAARPCSKAGKHAVLAAGFGGHLAAAVLQGTGHGEAPPRPTRAQR